MRRRRRGRKLATAGAAVAVLLGTVVSYQAGWFGPGSPLAEVAGVVHERAETAEHAGFDSLGRMRLIEPSATAPPPVTSAPAEAVPAPAPGEVAVAPPPETFDAPPPPPAPPPAPLRSSQFDGVTPAGGTWAVMIGINDYPGSRYDLRSAVADVEDVNEALARMGVPGGNRLLIRNGQATAGTIRAAADWLRAHAGPDAVAVFFYAGHVRKVASGTEAIVGADGGLVHDSDLARLLDGMQARRVWVGIAACYGGGFTEVLKPGRVLTAAAASNQLAYENEKLGRSYLVEYMVRRAMIQGGIPTVEAAFAFAQREISRDYPNRVPVQFDDEPAEVDLRQPKPPPPAPTGGSAPPPSGTTPTTQPPPPDDGCSQLTVGIVRCDGDG